MSLNDTDSIRAYLCEGIGSSIKANSLNANVLMSKVSIVTKRYKKLDKSEADEAIKEILHQAFRQILHEAFTDGSQKPFFESLITLAISACHQRLCSANLPAILVTDFFDCQSNIACEDFFDFVENNMDTWKDEYFFNVVRNKFLYLCNELLDRLSRTQNATFRSRILIFLAKFLPFMDPSGLNKGGEFNTAQFMPKDGFKSSVGDENCLSDIYSQFWILQNYFCTRDTSFNKQTWKIFTTCVRGILSAFENTKLDQPDLDKLSEEPNTHISFSSYITNRKMLYQLLSDHKFRRQVLVQFLISFQRFFESEGESQNVTADQKMWIDDTSCIIDKLMEQTSPNGAIFLKTIKQHMKRESFWIKWKSKGCPNLTPTNHEDETTSQEIEAAETTPEVQKTLIEEMEAAKAENIVLIGNAALTQLWNKSPDNMEACRSKSRDFIPTIEEFFEASNEETETPVDQNKTELHDWRALRLLSLKSPLFFSPPPQNPFEGLKLDLPSQILMKAVLPISAKIEAEKRKKKSSDETLEISNDFDESML